MEAKSDINRSGDPNGEEIESLKRRISSHPLYGLLLENHMDCLKVGSMGNADTRDQGMYNKRHYNKASSSMSGFSDLDDFMESYCMALTELKEAIKEPQQETLAFINSMYLQLKEMKGNNPHPRAPPANTSSDN